MGSDQCKLVLASAQADSESTERDPPLGVPTRSGQPDIVLCAPSNSPGGAFALEDGGNDVARIECAMLVRGVCLLP